MIVPSLLVTFTDEFIMHLHKRRKEVLFEGGGGGKLIILFAREIFGPCPFIEVQRSLVALEGATAVWS